MNKAEEILHKLLTEANIDVRVCVEGKSCILTDYGVMDLTQEEADYLNDLVKGGGGGEEHVY